jgi:hypothetical protein
MYLHLSKHPVQLTEKGERSKEIMNRLAEACVKEFLQNHRERLTNKKKMLGDFAYLTRRIRSIFKEERGLYFRSALICSQLNSAFKQASLTSSFASDGVLTSVLSAEQGESTGRMYDTGSLYIHLGYPTVTFTSNDNDAEICLLLFQLHYLLVVSTTVAWARCFEDKPFSEKAMLIRYGEMLQSVKDNYRRLL